MDLSISIVSWNTRLYLADCLRSIEATMDGLDVEVIVVDNASHDSSADMVRQSFPWVRLVQNQENLGFARANNQAIRMSRADLILLLNSDTEVRSSALAELVEFMRSHRKAGAAGARLLNTDGSLQPSCHPMLAPWREIWRLLLLDRISQRSSYPMDRWGMIEPRRVDVIKGACLMLRREALDTVGLLDERYFMFTEEIDLCHRLAVGGWELWWIPRAEVLHHGGISTRQIEPRMNVELYRSKVQFVRKFSGERQARLFKIMLRLVYRPRLLFTALTGGSSSSSARRLAIYRAVIEALPEM
jgi:GT2 family glycosyltransferase